MNFNRKPLIEFFNKLHEETYFKRSGSVTSNVFNGITSQVRNANGIRVVHFYLLPVYEPEFLDVNEFIEKL